VRECGIRFTPPPANAGDATRAVPRGEVARSVTSPSLCDESTHAALAPARAGEVGTDSSHVPDTRHPRDRPLPPPPLAGRCRPAQGLFALFNYQSPASCRACASRPAPLSTLAVRRPHVLRRTPARPSCRPDKRTSHRGCRTITLDSLASRPSWTTKKQEAKIPKQEPSPKFSLAPALSRDASVPLRTPLNWYLNTKLTLN
jgi:hypothetical protein